MADRRQLEAELAKLDTRLDAERQAVSVAMRQLDDLRPIPGPSTSCGWHPEAHTATELRVVLAARRDALSRLEVQRAAVAARLEQAKRFNQGSK